MARKSSSNLKANDALVDEAVEEFEFVAEMKLELATSAYKAQDADTRKMIDALVAVVEAYATGHISVPADGESVQVKVDQKFIHANVLYVIIAALKTLALFDIRVGKFVFDAKHCSQCDAELGGS